MHVQAFKQYPPTSSSQVVCSSRVYLTRLTLRVFITPRKVEGGTMMKAELAPKKCKSGFG